MFSLIITIISIALVAALALATLYYGGDAFNRGSAAAQASRLINEGQQVNGAVAIYKADLQADNATAVTDLAGLATAGYLSQVPGSFAGTILLTADAVTQNPVDAEVCGEVQKRATGSDTVPATQPDTQIYGCYDDAVNGETFFYKF